MNKPDEISTILGKLKNPDRSVRYGAIDSLRGNRNPQVMRALVDVLQSDPLEHLRALAAEVLGESASDDVISKLIESYESESGTVIRSRIVEAIGKIGGNQSIEILVTCLQNERDENVLSVCIEQLGKFRLIHLAETFMTLLKHSNQSIVNAAIVSLLNLEYLPALDEYRKLARDPRPFVHVSAISCLRILGLKLNINIRNDLEVLLEDDRDSIRNTAKQMLSLYEKELNERG